MSRPQHWGRAPVPVQAADSRIVVVLFAKSAHLPRYPTKNGVAAFLWSVTQRRVGSSPPLQVVNYLIPFCAAAGSRCAGAEPIRRRLAQRGDVKLFLVVEDRACRPQNLSDKKRSRGACVRLHRAVLHCDPASSDTSALLSSSARWD
jgi:hypothetical protein